MVERRRGRSSGRSAPARRVAAAPATTGTMLRRGFTKRCARCGSGRLYRGWFRMADRCPRCGVRFEREEGFFTGAYIINFAITEGFLFVAIMVFVIVLANSDSPSTVSLAPVLGIGALFAIAAPMAFYPFARTIWFAIHLAAAPLEPAELAAADAEVLRALEGDDEDGA